MINLSLYLAFYRKKAVLRGFAAEIREGERKMKKRVAALTLTLLLALGMLPAASAAVEIPDSAVEFNGHYYQYYTNRLSWEAAQAACSAVGGHLVAINSQEEQTFLENYLSYQNNSALRGKYLIGLHRKVTGFEQWVTGEPVTYTNWGKGEPDNLGSRQDMVIFNNGSTLSGGGYRIDFGQWDDDTNSTYRYICEWDYKPVWDNSSDWSSPELKKAQDMNLIPEILYQADMTQPITRLEFAAVAVKTYEKLSGTPALPAVTNPFIDCRDTEVLKAYNLGITNGTSLNTFSPNNLLNRQEVATMLTRTFKRVTIPGWEVSQDARYPLSYTRPAPFADDAQIASWARESVYFMAANNIIRGIDGNRFAPVNSTTAQEASRYANATREQALAIAVRMVENL